MKTLIALLLSVVSANAVAPERFHENPLDPRMWGMSYSWHRSPIGYSISEGISEYAYREGREVFPPGREFPTAVELTQAIAAADQELRETPGRVERYVALAKQQEPVFLAKLQGLKPEFDRELGAGNPVSGYIDQLLAQPAMTPDPRLDQMLADPTYPQTQEAMKASLASHADWETNKDSKVAMAKEMSAILKNRRETIFNRYNVNTIEFLHSATYAMGDGSGIAMYYRQSAFDAYKLERRVSGQIAVTKQIKAQYSTTCPVGLKNKIRQVLNDSGADFQFNHDPTGRLPSSLSFSTFNLFDKKQRLQATALLKMNKLTVRCVLHKGKKPQSTLSLSNRSLRVFYSIEKYCMPYGEDDEVCWNEIEDSMPNEFFLDEAIVE